MLCEPLRARLDREISAAKTLLESIPQDVRESLDSAYDAWSTALENTDDYPPMREAGELSRELDRAARRDQKRGYDTWDEVQLGVLLYWGRRVAIALETIGWAKIDLAEAEHAEYVKAMNQRTDEQQTSHPGRVSS